VARPTTPAIRASYSCAGLDPNIDPASRLHR
jgi:hypothetical protein